MNLNESMQNLVAQYRRAGQPFPATARDMADWAVKNNLYVQRPDSAVRECSELIARALREEYTKDPQGRTVRTKHAARLSKDGLQGVLWGDIRDADPEFMRSAFQQRRSQIVGDCRQLKIDVDSYNENSSPDKPVQMVFDFRDDLAEIEAMESLRNKRKVA